MSKSHIIISVRGKVLEGKDGEGKHVYLQYSLGLKI